MIGVTSTGSLCLFVGVGATDLGKAEDAAHTTGDTGVQMLGVVRSGSPGGSFADADGDYISPSLNSSGAVRIDWITNTQSSNNSPLRNEDAAFGNGEALVVAGAVINTNQTAFSSTQGDIAPIAVNTVGAISANLNYSDQSGTSLMRVEDGVASDGNPGIPVLWERESSISVDQSNDGDYARHKTDKFGMALTQAAPPESWFKCVSASDITDTNAASVCSADASNVFNITTISCSNTDATVVTRVDILDDTTVIDQGALGSQAAGTSDFSHTFWPPLKTAAVNKAVNAQAATNSAQVRCSISGFKTPS